MKKIALNLDVLSVQSFATGKAATAAGTVLGHGRTIDCPASRFVCPDTEYDTCGIVCLPTYQTGACICQ
ncbi:MAG TPA: hypothetical protein VEX86_20315 [Longimicrobium sp.]|nr:hypothetical protein [Longimicrobium sp.]